MLEIRDEVNKQVSFAAVDYSTGAFRWKNVRFEEPWWINLAGVSGEVVLFTLYTDTHNPDAKSLLAYHLSDQKIIWWQNDFSISAITANFVIGYSFKFGLQEMTLDLMTGKVVPASINDETMQNFPVIRPFQYLEGAPDFETVKSFLQRKLNMVPLVGIDYLEHDNLIFISCYVQENGLANFLIVLSAQGEVLLREKTGEALNGIGMDTFFILEGSLFFVKNKRELVRYKVV